MSATSKNTPATELSTPGSEIFEQILTLSTQGVDLLLENLFSRLPAAEFHKLSARDSIRLVSQVEKKKRVIRSAFMFQIEKNFADLKTGPIETPPTDKKRLELVDTKESADIEELESIIPRFEERYSHHYRTIIESLSECISLQDVALSDNPVHVRPLCQSFQHAIDGLNLESIQKMALYELFADNVIERLEPLYNSLEQCFIEHNIQPNLKPMPKKTTDQAPSQQASPSTSVAMSHIPVLMGVFQSFKDKSNHADDNYSNLFPELKETLGERKISDFDHLIDQLSAIFEIVFADEDLPDRIKEQIARLQIFVFMSEIHQSGFPVRSSHPARRLINTIIRTEVDYVLADQEIKSGFDFLRQEIDKISNNPFIESQTYADVCDQYVKRSPATSDTEEKQTSGSKVQDGDILVKIEPVIEKAESKEEKPEPVAVAESKVTKPDSAVEAESKDAKPDPVIKEVSTKNKARVVAEPKPVPKVEEKPEIIEIELSEEEPVASNKIENIYAVVQSIVNDITLPLRVQGRSLILFDEVWSPLLLEVATTQGFKSQAWQKVMTIAKSQAWVLSPKSSQADLDKLMSTIAHVEKSLSQSMQSLSMPVDQQASLLEFLEHEQTDVISQSKAHIEENSPDNKPEKKSSATNTATEKPEKLKPAKDKLADTIDEFSTMMETGRFNKSKDMLKALKSDKDKQKPVAVPKAQKIHKSDWVEIKKGNSTILAKLSWKADDESLYIFVDREGNRVCEISQSDLNKELKAGHISLISSTPVSSQRSAFSIIQTIK